MSHDPVEGVVGSAIKRLLAGSVIIVVDFRVSGFDVLLDLAGALLVAWAIVDIYRRYPTPTPIAQLMVVAAAVTVAGGVSDLVQPASAELRGGAFSTWAAVVSLSQVLGSFFLATVLARNLSDVPEIGSLWRRTARDLRVWAVPFSLVVFALALAGSASGALLLLAVPIVYGLIRHLVALVRTVLPGY